MQQILCPECPQVEVRVPKSAPPEQQRVVMRGSNLMEVEQNYSGCGVDHYQCPTCEALFSVSYKIDEITKIG